MTQRGAFTDMDALVAHVLRTLFPLLDEGRGDLAVPAGGYLDAFGQTRQPVVLHDDVGMGVRCRGDDQMHGIEIKSVAVDLDEDRLVEFAGHGDRHRMPGAVPLHDGRTIAWGEHRTCRFGTHLDITDTDPLRVHGRAVDVAHRDGGRRAGLEDLEELLHACDRRKAPVGVLGPGHGEIIHVEGTRLSIHARRHGRRHGIGILRIRYWDPHFLLRHRFSPPILPFAVRQDD
jgi:hypothetical protein